MLLDGSKKPNNPKRGGSASFVFYRATLVRQGKIVCTSTIVLLDDSCFMTRQTDLSWRFITCLFSIKRAPLSMTSPTYTCTCKVGPCMSLPNGEEEMCYFRIPIPSSTGMARLGAWWGGLPTSCLLIQEGGCTFRYVENTDIRKYSSMN